MKNYLCFFTTINFDVLETIYFMKTMESSFWQYDLSERQCNCQQILLNLLDDCWESEEKKQGLLHVH